MRIVVGTIKRVRMALIRARVRIAEMRSVNMSTHAELALSELADAIDLLADCVERMGRDDGSAA